jgi:hypothetical protein
MTTTEKATNAWGRAATGIPPIECPNWCTDPGHVAETGHADQNCYSNDAYVTASLDEVEISKYGIGLSRISATAYRGFNQYPGVRIHIEGFRGELDEVIDLTPGEANQLAQYLLVAVQMIGGRQ